MFITVLKIIVTGYLLNDGVPFPAVRGAFMFVTASRYALGRADGE
jgi:hypothetical protein